MATEFRVIAERITAVEERFVAWAMEHAGISRAEAFVAMRALRKGGKRAPLKLDWVCGQFTFSHGAFADADVIRRAAVSL